MDQAETTTLLREARSGSADALNRLFERCAGRLLALIRLRMGPGLRAHMESRDLLHDTLLKAFQRIDQFERRDGAALMAWLGRIAENEIRDRADYHGAQRRDAARLVTLEQGFDGVAAQLRSQTSRLVLRQEMQRIERALERLDESHREVIVLRKLQELSFREIGERLGRSPDACRMQLARAMTALTRELREES